MNRAATTGKMIHCIAGMPRAGATRLANLLAQNPRFHASSPGGMLAILLTVRDNWDALFAATPNESAKIRVMTGVLRSFYSDVSQPVIVDRSPAGLAHLEMLELLTGGKLKVLVPVRDIRDILASFELVARREAAAATNPSQPFLTDTASIASRCETWVGKSNMLGLPYTRIEDALARGLRDRMHFVRFEDLIARPRETMRNIYDFLGEAPFDHDPDNLTPVSGDEDHEVLTTHNGATSMHSQMLGTIAEKYKGVYVWDQPQWK